MIKNTNQCSQCHKTFSQITYPFSHLKACTGGTPYLCRQCDKTFQGMLPALHKQTQHEVIIFKGIKLINPTGKNLCYINAPVNAFLNCTTIMNLV